MIRCFLLSAAAIGSLSLGGSVPAETTVATDPVGLTTIRCLANSDTYVSVPLTRPPEFVGAIKSIAGNTITVSGSPWTSDQFVYAAGSQPKTYFVLIGSHASSNPKEGNYYTVTANGTNTLTVDPEGEDLSAIQAQTQIFVAPYATLGSVFPASDADVSFIPSPSAFNRQTQILIPDYNGTGINLSARATYYFLNDAWRKVGRPSTENYNDDPFVSSGYLIVRNAGTGTQLATAGSVLMKKSSIPLVTRTTGPQDNFVSVVRPVDVALDDLGLITSGAFTASQDSSSRADQLIVFNNSVAGINKSASAIYYYLDSAWRKVNESASTDFGSDLLPAGSGFLIRKAATEDGATVVWKNAPTYF